MTEEQKKNHRLTRDAKFETRSAENGDPIIEGYFAVFDSPFTLWEADGYDPGAFETIARGAFDLSRDFDVRALVDHNTAKVLGRTTVKTLELFVDEKGLFGRIHINKEDTEAMAAYARVKRGDVSQCSIGFDVESQDIIQHDASQGGTEIRINKVKLYEVTIATFPAYEATYVEARHKEIKDIRSKKLEVWRSEALAKLKGEQSK